MKKSLLLLLILLAVASCIFANSCRSQPPPSRQRENLELTEYAKEVEFAQKAVVLVPGQLNKFSRLWQSRGDVYQSAVQLLKEHPVKSPQAVCAYRFASNPKLISVVLEDSGTPPLAVTVWNGGSQLLITDVNLAVMEKQ